jgi:hypothetical protein
MSIEITNARMLLPLIVSFKDGDKEYSAFIYLDQTKQDIIVPDASDILNMDEFKTAFAKYYKLKNPIIKVPDVPKVDFETPANFRGV